MPDFEPSISDEAVKKATGLSWAEWFSTLRDEEMSTRTHREIVAFLSDAHNLPTWWQQAITDTFEQYIGRRQKNEMPDGFEISVSRTIDYPQDLVFETWADPAKRVRWMRKADFDPTTIRPITTIRGKWLPDDSRIDATFTAAGEGGCTLCIQHRRLPNEVAADRAREIWNQILDRLEGRLKSQKRA